MVLIFSLFSKDASLRKKWADQVNRTRENGSHRSILHYAARILKMGVLSWRVNCHGFGTVMGLELLWVWKKRKVV